MKTKYIECSMCDQPALVTIGFEQRRGFFKKIFWAEQFELCPYHAKEWFQRQVISLNAGQQFIV